MMVECPDFLENFNFRVDLSVNGWPSLGFAMCGSVTRFIVMLFACYNLIVSVKDTMSECPEKKYLSLPVSFGRDRLKKDQTDNQGYEGNCAESPVIGETYPMQWFYHDYLTPGPLSWFYSDPNWAPQFRDTATQNAENRETYTVDESSVACLSPTEDTEIFFGLLVLFAAISCLTEMYARIKCHDKNFAVAAIKYNDLMHWWVFRTLDAVVVVGIIALYVIGVGYAYLQCTRDEDSVAPKDWQTPMEKLYDGGGCVCESQPSYSDPNVRVPLMRVNYPDSRDSLERCVNTFDCADRFKRCMNETLFSVLVLVQTAHKVFKRHPVNLRWKSGGFLEENLTNNKSKTENPPTTQL